MDYGYVLKRAWEIICKFKILWIFGILASCGQASTSGGSNSGYRFSIQNNRLFPQLDRFFTQPDPAVIGLLIGVGIFFILAVIVLVILLGTIGRVGLIRGTVKAEQGAERLTFGELWRDGLKYFWRVFVIPRPNGMTNPSSCNSPVVKAGCRRRYCLHSRGPQRWRRRIDSV